MREPQRAAPLLPVDCVALIVRYAGLRRAYACVDKSWAQLAQHESLWCASLEADFGVCEPCGPCDSPAMCEPCGTYREAYRRWASWALPFGGITPEEGPLALRALRCWARIKSALRHTQPNVLGSLRDGARFAGTREFNSTLRWQRPVRELQALYLVHNGQRVDENSRGLFGSIAFYDRERDMVLLPMEASLGGVSPEDAFVNMARDKGTEGHVLSFNPRSGELCLREASSRGVIQRFATLPPSPLGFFEAFATVLEQEGLAEWPLDTGIYGWPTRGPGHSMCVSFGIEVRGSYRFVPSLAAPGQHPMEQSLFVYQFSIRALGKDDARRDESHRDVWPERCRLLTRHWELLYDNNRTQVVNGEGVVGLQPRFNKDGAHCDHARGGGVSVWHQGPFVYQSCTPAAHRVVGGNIVRVVEMKGSFEFGVEDSAGRLTPGRFAVRVQPLAFRDVGWVY